MKIAILSDIHGNATALKAVLDDCKRNNVDRYYFLGDYFDAGPQPIETYELLHSVKGVKIMGNHDLDLILYEQGRYTNWNKCCLYDSLLWTYRNLSNEMLDFIKYLPQQEVLKLPSNKSILLAHGSPDNISEALISENAERINEILNSISEEMLICGHTHDPSNLIFNNKFYVNPGSVGQPHNLLSEYAIVELEDEEVKIKHCRVPYNIKEVKEAYYKNGLLDEGGICARMNLLSLETGKFYYSKFKQYAREYAKKLGIKDEKDIPNEIWIDASKKWDWNIS